jgi:hypothetical protein
LVSQAEQVLEDLHDAESKVDQLKKDFLMTGKVLDFLHFLNLNYTLDYS